MAATLPPEHPDDALQEAESPVPTELDAAAGASPGAPPAGAYLVVRLGQGEARVLTVAEGEAVTVGRAPDASISINDPRVSRAHARITRRSGALSLEDLGSSNGTRVNQVAMKEAECLLAPGDVIAVGPAEIVVALPRQAEGGPASARGTPGEPGLASPPAPEGEEIVVADGAMRKVYQVVQRLARAQSTVLILGETGVGKEIVAERIHRSSPRAGGPFVRLNCASIPETLVESELFGHEKAAFTGADRRKIGYLEAAQRGTLLLDEIGELPLPAQAKLLRALESRAIARVGGTQEIDLDVRVLCATHRDLAAEVAAGRFRQDLFYRVGTFVLRVPPLRERRAEIAPLVHRFARLAAERLGERPPAIAKAAMKALEAHAWPGNIRELRNAIDHAVVLAEEGVVAVEHLPPSVTGGEAAPSAGAAEAAGPMPARLAELEKKSIEEALAAEGNNQTRAAKRLGISRRALLYKLHKHGLRR